MQSDTLRQLIEGCRDRYALFASVSRRRSDPEVRALFRDWASRRENHVKELTGASEKLDGNVETDGSLWAGLRRGLAGFKSAVVGQSLSDDVEECRMAERFALRDYDRALHAGPPESLRGVFEKQREEAARTIEGLDKLVETREVSRGSSEGQTVTRGPAFTGRVDCHGFSHAGRKREANEDHFLLAELGKSLLIHNTSLPFENETRLHGGSQGQLLLVSDGIGGQAGGERASRLAVDTVTRYVLNMLPWFLRVDLDSEEDLLEEELKKVIERCEWRIQASADKHPERSDMGTTLTMGYALWPNLYVIHLGDSRCYLHRGSRLKQVTTDHTVARQMVEQGTLEETKADDTRWSHVLWNSLGGGSGAASPDVLKVPLELGDTVVLCTDGLTREVSDVEIREVLEKGGSSAQSSRELVDLANRKGGRDNITVAVARFEKSP